MSDNKPEDGEKPVIDTTDGESSAVVSPDVSPDDVDLTPAEPEAGVVTPEAEFAASESDQPVAPEPEAEPEPAPVPEPESYALMSAGLLAVGWVARRRRVASSAALSV